MNKFLNTKNNLDLFEKDEYLKFDRLEDFYSINLSNQFRVLDLFCGCGGISLGFKREGFEIVAGIDNDRDSLVTFKKNLDTKVFDFDLSKYTWKNNIFKNIDVLVGGPPCQGFSLTGTRVKDDPRNKLYAAFLKAIDILNPKIVLIENVKGMSSLYNGEASKRIQNELYEKDYFVSTKVLNSAFFGVPQIRERFFIIACKKKQIYFPKEILTSENFITTSEAISDLPSLEKSFGKEIMKYESNEKSIFQKIMRKSSSYIYNHVATKHKDFVVETIKQVPEGGNHKDLPKGVGESRKFNEAWTRYHGQKPSKTIDTGHRNHFHYKYNRVPTVRENARLQSFPDTFRFFGSKTSQNKQVGNAVPVFLAQSLAKYIKSKL